MSRSVGAGGLLLVDDGASRRLAVALSRPARIGRADAVFPADGGFPEVAAVDGRIVAARSLSAVMGWAAGPEPQALDFGAACLLVPRVVGVASDARVESAGFGCKRKLWWRAPDGAIIEVVDPVRLLQLEEAAPVAIPQPSGIAALYADGVLNIPAAAVRRARSARNAPLLPPRRFAAGLPTLRVVDGGRLIRPDADIEPPACFIELAGAGGWVLAAPRLRLTFGAAPSFIPPAPRRLVAATIGRLALQAVGGDVFPAASEGFP